MHRHQLRRVGVVVEQFASSAVDERIRQGLHQRPRYDGHLVHKVRLVLDEPLAVVDQFWPCLGVPRLICGHVLGVFSDDVHGHAFVFFVPQFAEHQYDVHHARVPVYAREVVVGLRPARSRRRSCGP